MYCSVFCVTPVSLYYLITKEYNKYKLTLRKYGQIWLRRLSKESFSDDVSAHVLMSVQLC